MQQLRVNEIQKQKKAKEIKECTFSPKINTIKSGKLCAIDSTKNQAQSIADKIVNQGKIRANKLNDMRNSH